MARLHEYQGKAILAENGFKIPRGPIGSHPTHGLKPNSTTFISGSRTRSHHCFISFGASDASCWKRGSFLSGSNIGSSRSSAGVSGLVIAPLLRYRNSFCKAAMAPSGSPVTAATQAKISRRFGPSIAFFSNRPGASWLLTRQAVFQNVCE
jgi:hypothetical protein